MTIKEAAAAYGVSTQAIYQRVAKTGKKTKDITNRQTGELTEEGRQLLATWFANETKQETTKECDNCKALKTAISGLQAENKSLQAQIASLQADKDRLYTLLNQAQQTAQALTLARIGSGQTKTRPIWERLRVFVMGEKDENIQG